MPQAARIPRGLRASAALPGSDQDVHSGPGGARFSPTLRELATSKLTAAAIGAAGRVVVLCGEQSEVTLQFHYGGYETGDPRIRPAEGSGLDRDPEKLPADVDVLIVGAGPAGMILAAQLSQFPGIVTRIVERRESRLAIGQADGIACRSVETFQAFGFAERIIAESYRITQTAFWRPDPSDRSRIVRAGRTPDDPSHLSEFPHLVCNQARVQDYFADVMAASPTKMTPDFGWDFGGVDIPSDDGPVVVTVRRSAGPHVGEERTVRARYVVGCDGARSAVRQSIGRELKGGSANHAWGVMDVLAETNFPDVRLKSAIQSGGGGNILLIPREGGYLFRLYVDLGEVSEHDDGSLRRTTPEQAIDIAKQILHPYTLEVRSIPWHSVYEVGQRVTDKFDDVPVELVGIRHPRVFIAGDACHTHSAKAAQGMNVSMQDGFNLGWKLAAVIEGRSPAALLDTYSAERQLIAQQLIDFDKEWSSIMATRPLDPEHPELGGIDPVDVQTYYARSAEFTAGFSTKYLPSLIIGAGAHQDLATGFPVGRRFASAQVMRVADANPVQLGHLARADGRWRLYAFGGAAHDGQALEDWATWMATSPASPLVSLMAAGVDPAAVLDVKVIYPRRYEEVELGNVPEVFLPRRGPLDLRDYENVFAIDPESDIYTSRGLSRDDGCAVIVRPDQYVAEVLPLNDPHLLESFFGPIFTAARVRAAI